jgi:histidinol dehydrogenase
VEVERWDEIAVERRGGLQAAAAHLRARVPTGASVEQTVSELLDSVRERGDEAVIEATRRLDTQGNEPRPLIVSGEELDEAITQLPLDMVAGLQVAIANVAEVATASTGEDVPVRLPQGHRVTMREIAVGSAAVYVPGGRAAYPSTAVMGVVTARAAGVLDVVICSPPGPDGQVNAAILGTCRLLGVERVYRMGGAQAIAALAYGTETVERVDVIVGPGNLYVQEAKRQLSGSVGIDGFAGPSDLLVVMGEDADPQFVALDLLAQAEHGQGSIVVAISPSLAMLDAVEGHLQSYAGDSEEFAGCTLVHSENTRQAVELANAFAPEHLELVGEEPEALAPLVRRAGCVLVGAYSATAFGDYVAGSNHILPTGGAARWASGLSTRHFRRRMAEVRIDAQNAAKLAKAGAPIARMEGFEWHAKSMEARVRENQQP